MTDPTSTWDPAEHSETVDAFEAAVGEVTYRVWGADWCGDCLSELPDFFAALDAAGVSDDHVTVHEVDEDKDGELVEEYDVELIPTVVVERQIEDGGEAEEVARFEEEADRPAADYLARRMIEANVLA
jgi:thiol-disulfide isomerase/thioredoxin